MDHMAYTIEPIYASHSKGHDFLLSVWECVGTGELWDRVEQAWSVVEAHPNPGNLVMRPAGVGLLAPLPWACMSQCT